MLLGHRAVWVTAFISILSGSFKDRKMPGSLFVGIFNSMRPLLNTESVVNYGHSHYLDTAVAASITLFPWCRSSVWTKRRIPFIVAMAQALIVDLDIGSSLFNPISQVVSCIGHTMNDTPISTRIVGTRFCNNVSRESADALNASSCPSRKITDVKPVEMVSRTLAQTMVYTDLVLAYGIVEWIYMHVANYRPRHHRNQFLAVPHSTQDLH